MHLRLGASHFGGAFIHSVHLEHVGETKTQACDLQLRHAKKHSHVFSTCPSLQHLNTQAPDPFRGSGEAAQDECSVGSVGEEGLWINSIHFVLDANFPLSTLVFISFCFKEHFSCILMFTFMFHVFF